MTHRHIRNFFAALVFFALVLMSAPLWAQKDCRGHSCNGGGGDITSVLTGGDNAASSVVSIGGSRAYGVGGASFDVDINQCLASKAATYIWGLFGTQGVKQNLHCMGLAYVAAGNLPAAKHVLCDVKDAPLADMEDCPGPFLANVPQPAAIEDHLEEEEEHEEMLMAQQMLINDLQTKLENLPRPVQRTVIQQQPYLTEEKRAKLRELVE